MYVQGEMSDATILASLQYNGLIFVTNKAVLKSKSWHEQSLKDIQQHVYNISINLENFPNENHKFELINVNTSQRRFERFEIQGVQIVTEIGLQKGPPRMEAYTLSPAC